MSLHPSDGSGRKRYALGKSEEVGELGHCRSPSWLGLVAAELISKLARPTHKMQLLDQEKSRKDPVSPHMPHNSLDHDHDRGRWYPHRLDSMDPDSDR